MFKKQSKNKRASKLLVSTLLGGSLLLSPSVMGHAQTYSKKSFQQTEAPIVAEENLSTKIDLPVNEYAVAEETKGNFLKENAGMVNTPVDKPAFSDDIKIIEKEEAVPAKEEVINELKEIPLVVPPEEIKPIPSILKPKVEEALALELEIKSVPDRIEAEAEPQPTTDKPAL